MIAAAAKRWTTDEDAELRRRYPSEVAARIAVDLGRSPNAVIKRAKALRIVRQLRWTAEEDALLRDRYGRVEKTRIAEELGRSLSGILQRAAKLGLKDGVRWTADEDAVLHSRYGSDTAESIGQDLGRSATSVIQRARMLGLRRKNCWTAADEELLRLRYGTIAPRELAAELGRSTRAVQQRAMRLGIVHPRHWTEAEDAVIRARYLDEPASAIAADLPGRNRYGVTQRANDLGLRKADRFFGRGRVWTEADNAYLRERYGRDTAAAIARALGRTKRTVHAQARRLGVSGPLAGIAPPDLDDQVRAGHAAERYDHEIARHAGVCTETVKRRRAALGLASSTQDRRTREFVARVEAVLSRTGCRTPAELRWRIEQRRATLAGWPTGISRQGVRILNVLWNEGPMTRRELAERLDVAWSGTSTLSSGRWGLPGLVRAGLVVAIQRAARIGNASFTVYMLSLDVDRGPIQEEISA